MLLCGLRSRSRDRHRHSRDSRRKRYCVTGWSGLLTMLLCRSRSHSRDRRRRSRSYSRERYRGSPQRSYHQFHRDKKRSPSPDKSPNRPITLGPPAKRPSPNAEPPSVERDRRTVMCMQLSAKASPHDLEEFFQKVGQVCDVKMISDRNSRRSKGIAYVEFYDEGSVLPVSM